MAAFLVGLIVLSFTGDDSGDQSSAPTTAGLATTTSKPRGFPPAAERSVCRALITAEEVERLVGHAAKHEVIEPQNGQCAWPTDEGNPYQADLFFEVLSRGEGDFESEVSKTFEGGKFRLDAADGLGDEAYFAIRLTDPQVGITSDFVEGLYVDTGEVVIVLASGGRDIWAGTDDDVRARLRSVMVAVLDRVAERTDTT
ncbi:MAG: hypothetical protein HYU28_03325 [Actinobacteria bacterium]|nr:hypothetical protein [Actinomycetota bacterium]